VAGYLYDGHQFGQIVEPVRHDLVGVRLWLPRPTTPGAGTVILHIQAVDSGAELATAELAVAELAARGPTTFRFAPAPMDRLTTTKPVPLKLLLETRAVDRAGAVSVLAGPNGYSNGMLLRDDQGLPRADLAFEPLYQSRWLDRLLVPTGLLRLLADRLLESAGLLERVTVSLRRNDRTLTIRLIPANVSEMSIVPSSLGLRDPFRRLARLTDSGAVIRFSEDTSSLEVDLPLNGDAGHASEKTGPLALQYGIP
jgi:hypothetical protein